MILIVRYLIVLVLIPMLMLLTASVNADREVQVMAPGWGDQQYEMPEPGSYKLPPFGHAGDGKVLLSDGQEANLKQIYGKEKITVLSFIYTQCDDANGCPLATFVLHSVKNRLKKHPELANSLRMVSLSFDPVHDTPATMTQYGKDFQQDNFEWLFATTKSEQQLEPILQAYGQSVMRVASLDSEISTFAHMLRVFLIDEHQRIRNIYSTDFLHPELLIADIRTLLLENTKG